MKIGIAISTFANEKTDDKRLDIIKRCLDSLSKLDIDVIIINDGSTIKPHLSLISSYNFIQINMHTNGGIARCKNTALKYFEDNDYDICFLMDDDVEILDNNFYKHYIEGYEKTGIHHFCLQVGKHDTQSVTVNNFQYSQSNITNGCFLMVTRDMIKKLGYFKILPFKYGHEHSNYSTRAITLGFAPGYVDIANSNTLIRLIHDSMFIDSGSRTFDEGFEINLREAFINIANEKYIGYVD